MKRKDAYKSTEERKKQRTHLKEVESIYSHAEQYRLATVKSPIDALTPEWSIGTNRSINEAHKRRLCQIFKDVGVLRRDTSRRLQVACTKAQVQKMLDYLKEEGRQAQRHVASEPAQEADLGLPSFENWSNVIGKKAELMAGNHRVKALEECLQCSQSSQAERWWVCDIYDKGAKIYR
jgi:hypothetical protein